MASLYIIATPIGNLQDITLRAIETLKKVSVIACEDTRRTGMLMQHLSKTFGEPTEKPRLVSYFEHNEDRRIPAIIALLKQDIDVALVSDAGTPTISDPGFRLVRECVKEGIRVESIPGPSAVISALVMSGLPTDKFTFLGYLPKKESHKKKLLEGVKSMEIKSTIILYESPYRLVENLEVIKEILGDIEVTICSELTKVHEKMKHDRVEKLIEHFKTSKPRGEYVVLFHTENDN